LKSRPASPPRSTSATSTAASCFTGPSAGLRGFIFEILARQRARDSCEVNVDVRKGEEREEEEVDEKARRDDTEDEEEEENTRQDEEALRAPSPIARPTLCILSFLL